MPLMCVHFTNRGPTREFVPFMKVPACHEAELFPDATKVPYADISPNLGADLEREGGDW